MPTKRIKVTRNHIDRGETNHGENCPIGLALQQAGFSSVEVTGDQLELESGEANFTLPLPKSMQNFIEKFDGITDDEERKRFKPFEFEIELPRVKNFKRKK